MNSGASGPAAFKIFLTDFTDSCAARSCPGDITEVYRSHRDALFSLTGVSSGLLQSAQRETCPLGSIYGDSERTSPDQNVTTVPNDDSNTFPGRFSNQGEALASLTSMWSALGNLKHNIPPAIDTTACTSVLQAWGSYAPSNVATIFRMINRMYHLRTTAEILFR